MKSKTKILNSAVIIASLGYLVDIYDLVLFSIVRSASLTDLGIPVSELKDKGLLLINIQMIGMLIGGIIWGVLGDKKGRLSVLFGSIVMYSIANLLNGMVQNLDQYMILRFIAGVGLAGELGAGITLVSEIMSKETRGWGTTIVATVGVSGAVLAGIIFNFSNENWRLCYYIGGGLGLALLLLRVSVFESGMFDKIKKSEHRKGRFLDLFKTKERAFKYIRCILIGLPTWFTIGILVTFSPEFAPLLGISEPIKASYAIIYCYAGITIGDFLSGFISQILKSRKKVMTLFLSMSGIAFIWFYNIHGYSAQNFYLFCLFLGIAVGFWAILVTIASESFGTNLRATATTTVPNFVRGSIVLITMFYQSMVHLGLNHLKSAFITGMICVTISLLANYFSSETFGKDLDYLEN